MMHLQSLSHLRPNVHQELDLAPGSDPDAAGFAQAVCDFKLPQ